MEQKADNNLTGKNKNGINSIIRLMRPDEKKEVRSLVRRCFPITI